MRASVIHAYPDGVPMYDWISGCIGASLFPFFFMFAPIYVTVAITAVFADVSWATLIVMWFPIVVSVATPPIGSLYLVRSWPFKYIPAYFDYSEISETSDEELDELMNTKRVMFVGQPHGVFAFAGASSLELWSLRKFWTPSKCPTVAATVLTVFPFIKQLCGMYGMIDASSKSIANALKEKSVILYAGGISEFFLTDDKEERLYINKHKGFVRVALKTGVSVVPLYMFGNTTTLRIVKGPTLARLGRRLHITLTWFWGVYGTFVPFSKKCVVVVGKPMNLPTIRNPDQETVDMYHARYVGEVKRLFDTYKKYHPDYSGKELHFAA